MRSHRWSFVVLWTSAAVGGYAAGRGWWLAAVPLLLFAALMAVGGTAITSDLERRRR